MFWLRNGSRKRTKSIKYNNSRSRRINSSCCFTWVSFKNTNAKIYVLIKIHFKIFRVQSIVLGLGGSATSDGGIGILTALGGTLIFKNSRQSKPGEIIFGRDLLELEDIDLPEESTLPNVEVVLATDVANLFTGPQGAVRVFSKQKGANPATQDLLEEAMLRLQNILTQKFRDISFIPGAGAAGGIAGTLLSVLHNVRRCSGINLLAEALQVNF